jgi:hypothetical protein
LSDNHILALNEPNDFGIHFLNLNEPPTMNQSKLTTPRPLPCLKNFFTPISKARYQFQVLKDQLLADERAMQQKENDEQARQKRSPRRLRPEKVPRSTWY